MTDHSPRDAAAATAYVEVETPRKAARHEENRLEVHFDKADNPQESASKQASSTDGKIVSFGELFSYADSTDKLLMAVGLLGGIGSGLAQPLQIVLFGDTINSFNPSASSMGDSSTMRHNINKVALNFVFLGIGVIVAGFIQVACWSITASRQAKRIRSA
ncbi:hypothetical protein Gpo141_00013798, partial [Globisporangium polare]